MDIRAQVDGFFDGSSIPDDGQPVAVIISGGIAAGKTTLRKNEYATGYVLIDAVDIFLSLAHGQYFDFPGPLEEPMDRIGRLVAARAVTERRNIVTEIVGMEREPTLQLIESLRSVGYLVHGNVVTGDLDEELRRNEARGDDDVSSFYAEPYQRAWIIDACQPRKILYVDMDGVVVDFQSGLDRVPADVQEKYRGDEDDIPGVFALMEPMAGAVEAFWELSLLFDTYILSTAPWGNPTAWSDKLLWVRRYLDDEAHKRLILTHHKDLNRGDFLIDNRESRGAADFEGAFLQFDTEQFPDWEAVLTHLRAVAAVHKPEPVPAAE